MRADEINYDYTNERVSAVGNVQIYYSGTTLEADRVIYDQKTKRLHAEGNVRLTEPDGKSPTARSSISATTSATASSNSLRLDRPEQTRLAASARRSHERQLHGIPERRLHRLRALQGRSAKAAEMAGQGGADHPRSGREDDVFRGARLEFFGVPLAWMPVFLGARSDREAQERLSDSDLQHQHDLRLRGLRRRTTGRWRPTTT